MTIQSADIITDAGETSVTLIAFPEGADLSDYLNIRDTDGNDIVLKSGDVVVTQNAGIVGKFSEGSTVSVQLSNLQTADVTVTSIAQNYLGNYVYMTQDTCKSLFDRSANGALILLTDGTDEETFTTGLESEDYIVSVSSVSEQRNSFGSTSKMINGVVGIVIVMSAALAFAVLFTLSTTNISERERELATIKVLGFYNHEVHVYINKEMMILTGIGILIGLPVGRLFAGTLTWILDFPSIYLKVTLLPSSYLWSVLLTFGFAVAVSIVMNRVLDAIDPAEALKSPE